MCDRDACSGEIKVTPEMLDAGMDCFFDLPSLFESSVDDLRTALHRAFIAMLTARSGRQSATFSHQPEDLGSEKSSC